MQNDPENYSPVSSMLHNIALLLPNRLPVDVPSSEDDDLPASSFIAFADRLQLFLRKFRTIMSAVPFTTPRINLRINIRRPVPRSDLVSLRDSWNTLFPQQPPPVHNIKVSDDPTPPVQEFNGVPMIAFLNNAQQTDAGDVNYQDVFRTLEREYPGQLRKFVLDATDVDVGDLESNLSEIDYPGAADGDAANIRYNVFAEEGRGDVQGLHDDVQGSDANGDDVRMEHQIFCYFATQRRGEGIFRLRTSAIAPHPHEPRATARVADVLRFGTDALFQNFYLNALMQEAYSLANRFATMIISNVHCPRFPLAIAEYTRSFVVCALNNGRYTAHAAPLPLDRDRRHMIRLFGPTFREAGNFTIATDANEIRRNQQRRYFQIYGEDGGGAADD
jgi:hypothetical protein